MMAKWAMIIDLKRCNGCQACVVACKAENLIPPKIKWDWVIDRETGNYPKTIREFIPMLCMHCQEPPCVPICPTESSKQRVDGIVWNDYSDCIGCGQCIEACPYEARDLFEEKTSYYGGEQTQQEMVNPALLGVQPPIENTVQKCTFCMHRIDSGLKSGLIPGKDWNATPACVNACVTGARVFGDLDNSSSELSRLVRSRKDNYRMLLEKNTKPSVYYLPA